MGKRKIKTTPIRKLDVTVTELREIAEALDQYARALEDVSSELSLATRVRATRERIAPIAEFPRREATQSVYEIGHERGWQAAIDAKGAE